MKTAATITRGDEPIATYVIMGICVALGLGSMSSAGDWLERRLHEDRIVDFGLYRPAVADGEVYRARDRRASCTPGPFHLLVNMYSLYILGSMLEPPSGACASC